MNFKLNFIIIATIFLFIHLIFEKRGFNDHLENGCCSVDNLEKLLHRYTHVYWNTNLLTDGIIILLFSFISEQRWRIYQVYEVVIAGKNINRKIYFQPDFAAELKKKIHRQINWVSKNSVVSNLIKVVIWLKT